MTAQHTQNLPLALDLANWLESVSTGLSANQAAAELRRLHAESERLAALEIALEAANREHDLAYREAKYLAEALFKKYFAHDECYASGRVTWGVCDSTAGIISQIDNMVSKLVREPGEHTGGAA